MAGLTAVGSGAAALSGSGKTAPAASSVDALSTSRRDSFLSRMAFAPLLVCRDHRLAHPDKPVAQSLAADALRGHARALEQQEQFVGQHFRLRQFGSGAQLDDAPALRALECFDHPPR